MPRQFKNSKDETQKLIHSEEAKLKRLTDAYLQGVIELDDFAKHKSDIKQKISAMKNHAHFSPLTTTPSNTEIP